MFLNSYDLLLIPPLCFCSYSHHWCGGGDSEG
ncbi:hypothetical protein BAE44_0017546 [Dichanthelium oligosanthes]|uniref:Uncharacterized protein n=1 Tax=Dichanthelium oligosanthes TaxID=888268 RepID=A0A1E5V8E6_9POAL|nr:hypothetical protein BAE44_0017546 [Dichanthelium oligosanthes]